MSLRYLTIPWPHFPNTWQLKHNMCQRPQIRHIEKCPQITATDLYSFPPIGITIHIWSTDWKCTRRRTQGVTNYYKTMSRRAKQTNRVMLSENVVTRSLSLTSHFITSVRTQNLLWIRVFVGLISKVKCIYLQHLKIPEHKYSPSKTHKHARTHIQKHRYTNRRGDEKNTGNWSHRSSSILK